MDTIKPIKINARKANKMVFTEPLTAAEVGKLWATYMGNSMSKYILKYFLKNCDDTDIRKVLENSLSLCEDFIVRIEEFLKNDNRPIPDGFTENDVNLEAPRLFSDELYLNYLKYTGKAGLGLYVIAIPLVTRLDVREFYTNVIDSTVRLLNQVNDLILDKGFLFKIPVIPINDKVEYVEKKSYLSGFIGKERPLHALEVAHLCDNIENNAVSKALLIGFAQIARSDQVRKYFQNGKGITSKHIDECAHILHKEDMPSPPLIDDLVTTSTEFTFSDKLLMFHKIDMFSMRIRSYGNSMSVNGRHDLGLLFTRMLSEIGLYVNEGANIFIENGWMEKPPHAANRNDLINRTHQTDK
ncbi:DUF3231 family protein [Bacillus marasmi]|uniref:DUF3231 family protein n=1 Tax=Bacillus marasmi TaxID=1926279 RepID=UPI0011CC48E0|nr:DUF3231 family protein [Bacillus marasmi]